MAQPSRADTATPLLLAQVRECYGRVVYTTKTHEKAADISSSRLAHVKWWQIVLSALTTGGLVTSLLGDARLSRPAAVVAALLSTGLLILNAYTKNNDHGRLAEQHRETAAHLWDVRESYLSLLTDMQSGAIDEAQARHRRDELQARLVDIYSAAPRTSSKAYGEASIGLKQREELTFSDEELDKFLPPALRLTDK